MVFFRHCEKMEELIRGRESAIELDYLLRRLSTSETGDHLVALVEKILYSFENSIEMLGGGGGSSVEGSKNLKMIRSESESGAGVRISPRKDETGCNKQMPKKKKEISETWSEETSTLGGDGRSWRNTERKKIQNAEYPRNYYRYPHKYDRKCRARKLVQKVQGNPSKYKITYTGHHTCTNVFGAYDDEFILETTSSNTDSTILLNFSACAAATDTEPASIKTQVNASFTYLSSLSSSSVNNQEKEKEVDMMARNLNQYLTTSEHHVVSPEITSGIGDNVFSVSGVVDFADFEMISSLESSVLFIDYDFDYDALQELIA